MGSVFDDIAKALSTAAQQGEDVVKHVFQQVIALPDVIEHPLKHLFGSNFGSSGPGAPGPAPSIPPTLGGAGKLAGLLSQALAAGKTVAGTQPYTVTGYFLLASASAITKNTDIKDLFASAQTPAFTSDDTFPWPFQSYRMRWTLTAHSMGLTTAAAVSAKEADPTWMATLHATFSNATEIARVGLNNLGLRTVILPNYNTAIGAAPFEVETQPGVSWPVYYEKNGSYQMSLRSDIAVGTTQGPLSAGYVLDGWVINDPTLIDADRSQIQATLDNLLREAQLPGGSNMISLVRSPDTGTIGRAR